MDNHLLISDAAKEVQVESHVLRYWEEELKLPIKRNELGHRYYTEEDVERFKQIKSMKERGLQLKAIKMILKDGRLDVLTQENGKVAECQENHLDNREESRPESRPESREEKAQRLQWIMQQLIRQAVQENNAELVQQIRDSVLKELDYQFRMQEERDEERDRVAAERTESYYRKVDELLRKKSSGKRFGAIIGRDTEKNAETVKASEKTGKGINSTKKEKKKRHFAI